MEDKFFLNRFITAQNRVYSDVLKELRQGQKEGHWMWFIFPQADGLGWSPFAKIYAIKSMEEAKAYLAHSELGSRLRECVQLTLQITGRTAHQIFGYPDELKFRSSLTLFKLATEDNKIFTDALAKYFDGKEDMKTVEIITCWQGKETKLQQPQNNN